MLRLLVILQLFSWASSVYLYDCSKLQFWNREKRIEDKRCNGSDIYHCAWDLFSKQYKEICWTKRILIRKGKRPTIQGGLHHGDCSQDRYQPVPVVSNNTIDCWYIKSECSVAGQVACNDSMPDQDRTCRCDHTKGYAFVLQPKHAHYCIPSEEDCSCYKKICESEEESLTPDYNCVKEYNISDHNSISCFSDMSSENSPPKRENQVDGSTVSDAASDALYASVAVMLILVLYILLMLVSPLVVRKSKRCEISIDEGEETHIQFRVFGLALIKSVQWTVGTEQNPLHNCDKYSITRRGGTCTLLIRNTCMKDEGVYKCTVKNIVGIRCFGKNQHHLRISSQLGARIISETQTEIIQHRIDSTYYTTSATENAREILECNSIVFLLGHEGAGKTKACVALADIFHKNRFTVYKFSSNDWKSPTEFLSEGKQQLFIYDLNINFDQISQAYRDLIEKCKTYTNLKCVFTVLTKHQVNLLDVEICPKNRQILLDELTKEEKREILQKHMDNNHITTCDTPYESNHCDKSIVVDVGKTVKIYKKIVDSIVATDTLIGFPKLCHQFCSDRSLLYLEHKFFNTPPYSVIKDINTYRDGTDGFCKLEYIVLVYIMMKRDMKLPEVQQDLSGFEPIRSKLKIPGELEYYKIKDAADRLVGKFLNYSMGVYSFYHPRLSKAVWMSYSDIDPQYCVLNCDWSYIEDLVRPFSYQTSDSEICIKFKTHNIVERLVLELDRGYGSVWAIGKYLRNVSTLETDIVDEFCSKLQTKTLNTLISLNLLTILSELCTSSLLEIRSDNVWKMLLSRDIDRFENCLLHYTVLQDYKELMKQLPESYLKPYFEAENKKGYSPCHLEFYLGRANMVEKHIAHIPREYDYYTKLNKLFHIGKRNAGKYIKPKHLNIVGNMILFSDNIKRTKFGSDEDYKSVRKHLKGVRNETISVVRIKNLPTTVEDHHVKSALESISCIVLKQYRERHRQKGKITVIETGDQVAVCRLFTHPLPDELLINEEKVEICLDKQKDKQKHK